MIPCRFAEHDSCEREFPQVESCVYIVRRADFVDVY